MSEKAETERDTDVGGKQQRRSRSDGPQLPGTEFAHVDCGVGGLVEIAKNDIGVEPLRILHLI
jgi:hypothetical protein